MASRFVRPEETRIEISNGDWILVRKRLNHGEESQAFERRLTPTPDGWRINPMLAGVSQLTAYLLDWSLPEYPIRGKSVEDIASAVNALDPDDFAELRAAIQAHEEAVQAERAKEKKTRTSATDAAATSPSLSAAAGASTGSVS